MTRKKRAGDLPTDQIIAALGDVVVPGHLDDFSESMGRPKQNVLRTRRGVEPQDLPLATSPVPWYSLGYRPTVPSPKPSRFLAYAAADYYVQDAGSLLALAAVGADTESLRGRRVCDLCAAPGGKASALVEAVRTGGPGGRRDGGFVLANEVIGSRLGALKLNLARTGSDRYAVSSLDPDSLAERLSGEFDVVVVDAPCSGQALVARGRQKISALSAHQIQHSASRQHRILDAAVRLLREGGTLVYSTCTFAEAENEAQMQRLESAGVATRNRVERLDAYETNKGCYRLWPHLHDCAGSFAASMNITNASRVKPRRVRNRRDDRLPVDVTSWGGSLDESTRLRAHDSVVYGWPCDAPDWVDDVAVGGPEVAHLVGQTWKPSHALALRRGATAQNGQTSYDQTSYDPASCDQSVDVDEESARAFLRGEPITCKAAGWRVVRLGGRPLGWIKANGKIGKNHLPAAARIAGELLS